VKFVLPGSPLVSVLAFTLICASIIGTSVDDFKRSGSELILAVFFAQRRALPRLCGQPPVAL
jgi:hypothetical protein